MDVDQENGVGGERDEGMQNDVDDYCSSDNEEKGQDAAYIAGDGQYWDNFNSD